MLEAGGFPVEFPVISFGETLIKPTAMLYRNLVSMDVEESIRANPLDGVVLLCGCGKTTPSLVMGACSVNLPTLVISGGPMPKGHWKGKDIGTSDVWRFDVAGKMGQTTPDEFVDAEACMARNPRPLRCNGYCFHHGGEGRSIGTFFAKQFIHTGSGCTTQSAFTIVR